jgi:hypothetical protein
MKLLEERTWFGDHEIVYESNKPYTFLLTKLSGMAGSFLPIEKVEEKWSWTDAAVFIEIRFVLHGSGCQFTIERRGDYLDMEVLRYFNSLLFTDEYRFEYSPKEESIYFISAGEKATFETEGIVFVDL